MKNVVPIVAICVVAILIFGAMLFWPKPTPAEPCLKVPEISEESNRTPAMAVATKLQDVNVKGNIKAQVEEVSKVAFQILPEKELALCLLLRAIDCYSRGAKTDKDRELIKPVLDELAKTVRAMWAEEKGLRGSGDADRLSHKELDLLQESPYGSEIIRELKNHGVKPPGGES